MACGILVPWPGTEPRAPAVRARGPNHWIARGFHRTLENVKDHPKEYILHFIDSVYCLYFINIFIFVYILTSESECSLQWMVSWTVRNHEFFSGGRAGFKLCCSSPQIKLDLPPEECYFPPWKSKILRQRVTKNLTSCLSLGEIIESKTVFPQICCQDPSAWLSHRGDLLKHPRWCRCNMVWQPNCSGFLPLQVL